MTTESGGMDDPVTLICLLTEDDVDAMDAYCRQLPCTFYRFQTVPAPANAHDLLESQPDAILAIRDEAAHAVFSQIDDLAPRPERPLLVWLTEHPPADCHPADLTLPLIPGWLDAPLQTALNLRLETMTLCRQQIRLREEVEQLSSQVADHQRTTGEIDVLRNAIVRNVSHELRTPLLQIKSAVSMLAEDKGNNDTLATYAMEATARLETVVKNITQLADSLDTHPEPFILRDAMEQALRNLRRTWEHKNNIDRVKVNLPARLPPIYADRQAIGIVLQLLVDNALKFSARAVEVSAEHAGQQVIIRIRDYGIGISPEQIEKIFDPFYQVDQSSTRRFGGTGVGLAIVRLILERHGVRVNVTSAPGKGSTFWFSLDLAQSGIMN